MIKETREDNEDFEIDYLQMHDDELEVIHEEEEEEGDEYLWDIGEDLG